MNIFNVRILKELVTKNIGRRSRIFQQRMLEKLIFEKENMPTIEKQGKKLIMKGSKITSIISSFDTNSKKINNFKI